MQSALGGGFASAADRQRLQALNYNVASVVAYVPQKHLPLQNWYNLRMTHSSNASWTNPSYYRHHLIPARRELVYNIRLR